ncbi:MAG: immunoglobulin domain-containing protein, partial [Verrucomicrobia bacterium]|nr:immunoglobulin domain-containing protein [Verrucomicrobiota bacterium]
MAGVLPFFVCGSAALAEDVIQVGEPAFESSADYELEEPAAAQVVAAAGLYDHGDPTIYEQYMLELVNFARATPEAEAARLGITLNQGLDAGTLDGTDKQPLAFHPLLFVSARAHSDWMLANNIFSHTGVNGSTPGDRMAAAGYEFVAPWSNGENIAFVGKTGRLNLVTSTKDMHENLFKSPGHRKNLMNGKYAEVGIGLRQGEFTDENVTYNTLMGTQNFALSKASYNPFVVGVVFNDANKNYFYDPGEGIAGVKVTVSGSAYYAITSESGGYAVPYTAGGNIVVTFEPTAAAPKVKTASFTRTTESGKNVHVNYLINRPVSEPPVILTQPTGLSLNWGQKASLFVEAYSMDDVSYQWMKNNTPIPGATKNTYIINSATGLDAGNYSVVVSNSSGTVVSGTVAVTVPLPTFYVRADNQQRYVLEQNPVFTYTITSESGETVILDGAPFLATTAVENSPAGTYPIIVSQGSLPGTYQYVFIPGVLTVLNMPEVTFYSHGDPSPMEQYQLELINRARANPAAEAARLGIDLNKDLDPGTIDATPKPPYAFNASLLLSSERQSKWLLQNNQWTLYGEGGSTPEDRMIAAGYVFKGWQGCTESIVANYTTLSVDSIYRTLFNSGSQRLNIMDVDFTETGIGLEQGGYSYFQPNMMTLMMTQDFAFSAASLAPYLVGVVYSDLNRNGAYDIGEGISGVKVT